MCNVQLSTQLDLGNARTGGLTLTENTLEFNASNARNSFEVLFSLFKSCEQPSADFLQIKTKDFRNLGIKFPSEAECARHELKIARAIAAPPNKPDAFLFAKTAAKFETSSPRFDAEIDWKEMGVPNSKWRFSDVNQDFKVCASYPKRVVVPNDVDDEILVDMASYRLNHRFPIVSYVHPKTQAPLMLVAQPLAGNGNKRCYEDERMFRSVLQQSPEPDKNGYIIDLRSQAEVASAKSKGGGTEIIDHYFSWKLVFADLAKEQSYEESLTKFVEGCQSMDPSAPFMPKADNTYWLHHVKTTLSTAVVVARILVRESLPVVLHASTGFDRSILVSTLAQLLMESRYRTMAGFQTLIEREWLQLGHPFASRSAIRALTEKEAKAGTFRSPVFILFLDCVWQCVNQFPCAFEFNEEFLLTLVEHSQASRFGTFLFDNCSERDAHNVVEETHSLWDFCETPEEKRRLINIFFEPLAGWIKPSFRPQGIVTWFALYGRGSSYLKFHDEVHELMMYVKDKHDMMHEEVDRLKQEFDQLKQRNRTGNDGKPQPIQE